MGAMTLRRSEAGRALASASRVTLLAVLLERGPSHISDLAEATGLHPNTVREHLTMLLSVDFVRSQPEVRTVRGRPRMVYRVTSAADVAADPEALRRLEEGIAQARVVASVMASHRDDAAASEFVGDGDRTAPPPGPPSAPALPSTQVPAPSRAPDDTDRDILALEAHLDRIGFDPVYDRAERTFHLWRCPFLALAQAQQDVVCRIHVQLAQGVLDQVAGSHEVDRLDPFVGQEHCTLSLRERTTAH